MQDEERDDVEIEPEIKVEAESEDPELAERGAENKVAKVRAELKQCRKEKQEYMDGWQRAKADYVNALKRFDEEKKTAEQNGRVKAVETLLPAFDALERAKEHLPAQVGGEMPAEGFLAIAKQLEAAFAALGLEAVGEVGEEFDPALHEAFAQEAVDDEKKDGTVTAVLEKGWRINGFVIRPAKVKVGHFE